MDYQTAFYWESGCGGNQDSLLLQQVVTRRGRILFVLVSDGIGGMEEGETASGFLAEELKSWFYREGIRIACRSQGGRHIMRLLEKSMSRQLYRSSMQLQRYAKRRSIRLGATLVWVLLINRRYLFGWVGDSRAFLLGKRGSRLLTRDDVDGSGRLLKCIGSSGWYPPRFGRGYLKKGQLLLLCSDGFWKRLRISDLEAAAKRSAQKELQEWLNQTGKRLLERGERDDRTAVIIRGKKERKDTGIPGARQDRPDSDQDWEVKGNEKG